jgi:hypothetical protein
MVRCDCLVQDFCFLGIYIAEPLEGKKTKVWTFTGKVEDGIEI